MLCEIKVMLFNYSRMYILMNNRKKKNMKDKKWDILVVCVLAVLAILFLFLNGKEATVTFDSAGGSVVNSVKVKVNDNVSKPVNPTREGYVFVDGMMEVRK